MGVESNSAVYSAGDGGSAVNIRIVGLLFVLSGVAGLGLELIWAKELRLVLGGSVTGIAYVTALFMGGMAIGYAVGGRFAHRLRRPVMAYGVAELVLAAGGLSVVHLMPLLEGVGGSVYAYLGTALLILPCSFLAGITLPFLMEATTGRLGGSLGLLYALNTAGAVIGVLLVGLFFIGSYGLQRSALYMALVQLFVGCLAVYVGRSATRATRTRRPVPVISGHVHFWLVLAFAAGTTSLAEEVLWVRALIPHLNSSTYAFSIILAIFLSGLALGAAICARLITKRNPTVRLLVVTQLAAAMLVLVSPELLHFFSESLVTGYGGVRQATGFGMWLATIGSNTTRAALALLPPVILMGFSLPLLTQFYAGARHDRGAGAGAVTGWNSAGAVIGALGAHFLLLPAFGVGGALQFTAGLHCLVALGALVMSDRSRVGLLVTVLLLVATVVRPSASPFLGRLGEEGVVLMVDEGVQDTTAVIEHTAPDQTTSRVIYSNGISYAGDNPISQRYMRLLGHLPALLARDQRRALVICVGTGQTAAAVARHQDFEQIDLVDISPVVYRTLPLFADANDRIQEDPRVRIHIVDGRIFVAREQRATYDVITLEPPPPRAAGVAVLYSEEFYRRSRRLLAPGGAMAQWLPIHGLTDGELRMLSRTFLDVFPNAWLYLIGPYDAALVGLAGEGASAEESARRLARHAVATHLSEIGAPNPLDLPRTEGSRALELIGPGPLVTDDHPRIEHFATDLGWETVDEEDSRRAFLETVFGGVR